MGARAEERRNAGSPRRLRRTRRKLRRRQALVPSRAPAEPARRRPSGAGAHGRSPGRRVSERGRVEGDYATYASDRRTQQRWSAENPGNLAIRDEVLAAVSRRLPKEGRILDAGCGSGWLLTRLARSDV